MTVAHHAMIPPARRMRRPPSREVAPSAVAGARAQYIGEMSFDPRRKSGYSSQIYRDDASTILLYRDVLADQRAGQAMEQRLDAAVSKPWEVKSGGERRVDRLAAESLSEQLKNIGFDAVCRKMLHAVWFGYSVSEILYAPGSSEVVIESVRVRAPERFKWTADNRPRLKQPGLGEDIDLTEDRKFVILTRPGDNDDVPYAPGIARWCFWPTFLKRHGVKFWSLSLEKFATPTAKGTYPKSATDEELDKLVSVLQAMAEGIAVAIPEGQMVEIIESRQRSGGDYDQFCKYMDAMITTSILGQSSTTDQGPWRGTAEIQMEVRDETIAADCKLLDERLNATIARWLTDFNFPGAAYPEISREVESPEDLSTRAEREERISRTTGLKPTRRHVESVYGGEWEEPATAPAAETDPASHGSGGVTHRYAETDDDPIDVAAAEAASAWEDLTGPPIEPVLETADHSDDIGEFGGAVDGGDLPERMDTNELEGRLTNLGFSTDMSGRAE